MHSTMVAGQPSGSKIGKYASWTGTNRVRLSLIQAYKAWDFLRRLCLPNDRQAIKLIKMGGRLVRHSRRLIFSCPRCRFLHGWKCYRRRQAEGGYNARFCQEGEACQCARWRPER